MLSVGLNNLDTSISKPLSSLGREILAHGGTEAQAEKYTNRREAIRAGALQCTTCANRKYQDGSDEMVSFKAATHISPNAAGAAVRGHEGEHVSNAYKKAFQEGGKVVSVGVSIHTAVCPECGRTYVSGGTTHSVISTPVNEDKKNPYTQNKNALSKANSPGLVMDFKM